MIMEVRFVKSELRLVSIEEICELLHVSRSTAYKMLRNRELPGRKIGGKWQINLSKLEDMLNR